MEKNMHKSIYIGSRFSANAKICTQNEFMKYITVPVETHSNPQENYKSYL